MSENNNEDPVRYIDTKAAFVRMSTGVPFQGNGEFHSDDSEDDDVPSVKLNNVKANLHNDSEFYHSSSTPTTSPNVCQSQQEKETYYEISNSNALQKTAPSDHDLDFKAHPGKSDIFLVSPFDICIRSSRPIYIYYI